MAARPTVGIIYGFSEGPRLGQKFVRALERAGFVVTDNVQHADIIIAHSGGCFLIPPHHRARRLILIGLPYWPGRSTLSALALKIWLDIRSHHREGGLRAWLVKTGWNLVYFWRLDRHWRMWHGRKQRTLWQFGGHSTLIRAMHDPMCTPAVETMPFTHPPRFVEIPGQHDDCWRNPAPYVAVVQS